MNTPPQTRRLGEIVGGKYRLLRYLAAGGMGVVYEAEHTVVGRHFAIKLLHPNLASQRDSLARFQREAQAAGALDSEHVAAAVDFGIAPDGSPFMVMEYLAGESVRALLDRCQRLPVGRAVDIAVQASRGIAAAHRAGIVHRDLNPQNLFVCRREDGTDLVKVLDFGIAKLESIETTETCTGTIMGTPAYLAPEQARGERTVDQRVDIYGLGAVLYELLSGTKPHPGDSHHAILHHVCTQPALPLDGETLGLPAGLVEAVHGALGSQPDARPASAEAFATKVAAWAERRAWPAPPRQTLTEPVAHEPSAMALTMATNAELPRPSERRRPRRWVLLGATLSLLAAAAVSYVARRPSSRAPLVQPFAPTTQFFVAPPNPGVVDQIAALAKAGSAREAAAITAMAAAPQAIWFSRGTPEEVQSAVGTTMVRAAKDRRLRVIVANNRPYRDCTGLSAGGAKDTAAYEAWIDAFARGIGHERALVILEPESTGLLPYNTSLDGNPDPCRPTVTDGNGNTVAARNATADEAYQQIKYAVAALAKLAPNAVVYLDGTHPAWLRVGEAAYRLYRSNVQFAQGFAVNISNHQLTTHASRYGTWIAKCFLYATNIASDRGKASAFGRCADQPAADTDDAAWAKTDAWYAENVDGHLPAPPAPLLHFVIDTSRNGRGPLALDRYRQPPFNQPDSVIAGLAAGVWCNPPGTGLGPRPTVDTGIPLLDAYLWIKTVGESDGSCDIAGGTRAWDYGSYNPWGLTGDAQKHFDPLWGMIDPAAGSWFAEQALALALNAFPPL